MAVCLMGFQILFSQETPENAPIKRTAGTTGAAADPKEPIKPKQAPKASIDMYKIFTLTRDTVLLDTSLHIQKEYQFNYLRKDIFGLLPFANEGHTYTTLDFGYHSPQAYPHLGLKGKHFAYQEVADMRYYQVATPVSELYFKTVMEQGQNLDAFVTMNTSERLNFSLAYKGLRSLGKYFNQLSSTGNLRFTNSYHTANQRYHLHTHFTAQDFSNGENGGISNPQAFIDNDEAFETRARFEVFFRDATSFMKGNRYFVDHTYALFTPSDKHQLQLMHQFNYEHKFFEFSQQTLGSTVNGENFQRFGAAYVTQNLKDQLRYNRMFNRVGLVYDHQNLGDFSFFVDDYRFNQFYRRVIITPEGVVPSSYAERIHSVGGQYRYQQQRWQGDFSLSQAMSNHQYTDFTALLSYQHHEHLGLKFYYQYLQKLPDLTYTFFQSDYKHYNWFNDFVSPTTQSLHITATTPWVAAEMKYTLLDQHLYFSDDATDDRFRLVTPKQYADRLQYFSLKLSKDLKWRQWSLDNSLLYQQVAQDEAIINVPALLSRQTFYYTGTLFNRAMQFQTGIGMQYFTKFYADEYNPLIADFSVQRTQQIGGFPLMDVFFNARIQQTRIFLKYEHFNAGLTSYDYFNAPNYPFRDRIIRFGIVWNFFQ